MFHVSHLHDTSYPLLQSDISLAIYYAYLADLTARDHRADSILVSSHIIAVDVLRMKTLRKLTAKVPTTVS